jgi:hypothetical protein
MKAADFTREMQNRTEETAQIACDLSILCAKYAERYSAGQIKIEAVDELGRRIFAGGEISVNSDIFRGMPAFKPKPENAVKNLLIRRLQEPND